VWIGARVDTGKRWLLSRRKKSVLRSPPMRRRDLRREQKTQSQHRWPFLSQAARWPPPIATDLSSCSDRWPECAARSSRGRYFFGHRPGHECRAKLSIIPVAKAWSKDQRQQFGRFCHALSVASRVSFVGYWHSTSSWTWSAILNEAALAAIIVLTFTEGMDSMNGE